MLSRFKRPLGDFAYALLRVLCGLMFAFHGLQKLFGIQSKFQPPVFSQVWFGGIIELVCGVAIALGVQVRCAAFVASGTMAVAYIQYHWRFAFGARFWPAVNQGELALVYCLLFFYLSFRGASHGSKP